MAETARITNEGCFVAADVTADARCNQMGKPDPEGDYVKIVVYSKVSDAQFMVFVTLAAADALLTQLAALKLPPIEATR